MTFISTRRFGLALAVVVILASSSIARGQAAAGVTQGGQVAKADLPDAPSPSGSQSQSPGFKNPIRNQVASAPYEPITGTQRVGWVLTNTVLPVRLLGDAVYAAVDTALNSPEEYGPHWDGFGKRVGTVIAGTAISNTMEASIGSIWGEDPRYFRRPDEPFGSRLKSVISQTFMAKGRSGSFHPAYARYMAITGSSWIANTYLPDSVSTNEDAAIRALEGFGARMGSNAYNEFWPDVKAKLFHHGS